MTTKYLDLKTATKIASLSLILSITAIATNAAAQTAPVPDHPRVNEVNQRLDNQQNRIDKGEADGQISGKQAARDETHDTNIAKRESSDEAKHGGHLTKAEQRTLNKSENKNSRRIHRQRQ